MQTKKIIYTSIIIHFLRSTYKLHEPLPTVKLIHTLNVKQNKLMIAPNVF